MLSTRDPPQNKGHIQTEVKGWKKIFHANGDQKKAGVALLISDKIDFEIKAMKRGWSSGCQVLLKQLTGTDQVDDQELNDQQSRK